MQLRMHTHGLAVISCPSVRPPVRPSVKRVNCDKMKQSSADFLMSYERLIHLVFRYEEWLVGDVPFYLKFWGQTDPVAAKKRRFSILYH